MAGIDSYTKILVRGGGANGTYAFTDSSDNARTLTVTGTWNYFTTSYTKFQSSSIALTLYGNSYFTAASHADLELGSGDWVIDYWVNQRSTANSITIAGKYYWKVYQLSSGKPAMTPDNGTTLWTATNAISGSTWTHVAWVRNGNTVTCYCDGVANGSWSYSSTPSTSGIVLTFGQSSTVSSSIHVCFDEFRFSKGTNRGWTSNFTPPTTYYTGTSYNHTATGGAVTGGAATVTTPQVTNNADGGAVAGGTAGYNYNVLRHEADGGAVAGGSADTEIPLGFQWDGGVIVGGSADVFMLGLTGPTQHWTFENIIDGIVQNEIEGGATVYAVGNNVISDKWGGQALEGYYVESTTARVLSEVVYFQSISLWVKRVTGDWGGPVVSNASGQPIISVSYRDYDPDAVYLFSSIRVGVSLSGGDWDHIVVVIPQNDHSTTVYAYVNGVRDPNPITVDSIGSLRYLSENNAGETPTIDNVQLYDRALTDTDVLYLYEADNDLTTCPRFPDYAPVVSGGAVVGGTAEYYLRNVNYTYTASGGAVVGGQATLNHGEFYCTLLYPEGDFQADVTNVAVMDCTISLPTVSMDTAGYMECILQYPIVDITSQHTILADLESVLPYPVVDITGVNILLYSFDCTLPYPTIEILTMGSYYEMECVLLQPTVDINADAGAVFTGTLGFPSRTSSTYSNIPTSSEEILCFSRQ